MATVCSTPTLRPRLLLVDDDPSLLNILTPMLQRQLPYLTVEPCGSGIDALAQVVATPYQVVLSDLDMPQVDGLALLRGAKAVRPHMPFLLMTGAVDLALTRQAFDLGAFDVIGKPFDFPALTQSIRLAIKAFEFDRQCDKTRAQLTGMREVHAQLQARRRAHPVARKTGPFARVVPLMERTDGRIESSLQRIDRQIERLEHFLNRQARRRVLAEQQARQLAYARVVNATA
jgi:DNA-binding NtrC family response regulator